MFRLLAPHQYRRMPWKNGGGLTEEIAAHPEGSGFEAFDWRVSIAEITRDGPFSRFPGIDRTITLIEGAGMRLSGNGQDVLMRAPYEPHSFDGEDSVHCALLSGPIRDFNAMVRRDRARAHVAAIRARAMLDPADFRIAFAAIGMHECSMNGAAAIALAPRHTLVMARAAGEMDLPLAIRPLDTGGVALAVCIECR